MFGHLGGPFCVLSSQGRTFLRPSYGSTFSSFGKTNKSCSKKAEHEKTPHCFADSRFVPYMTGGLIDRELDTEQGKEGIKYVSRGLGHLIC